MARTMAEHPEVLLKTMVEKELGLAVEPDEGSPFQGALVMGGAFGIGAAIPVIPHLFLGRTWRSSPRPSPRSPSCS